MKLHSLNKILRFKKTCSDKYRMIAIICIYNFFHILYEMESMKSSIKTNAFLDQN